MSASTNSGWRTAGPEPPHPCFPVVWRWWEHHALIASVRIVPGCITPVEVVPRAASLASVVTGVGHIEARVCSDGVLPLGRDALLPFCELPNEAEVAVGQNEEPTPTVGGADVGRR